MNSDALTIDKIKAAMRLVPRMPMAPTIIFTATALEATQVRLFPASRHRSRRIFKKLLARHGGEFRMQPCMWRVGDTIYAHPSYRAKIEAQFKVHP